MSSPGKPPASTPTRQVNVVRRSRRWPFERRILAMGALLAAPGLILSAAVLFFARAPSGAWVFGWVPAVLISWVLAYMLRDRVSYPLRTLANLVEAMRAEDYSLRGATGSSAGAFSELITEINAMSEHLRARRFARMEAGLLLGKVIDELDAAVFTFDAEQRLTLANHAGSALLANPEIDLLGRSAKSLGLQDCLQTLESSVQERVFPGKTGRWRIQASTFRESGVPQFLLVITDLSLALRQEERLAWQRLIRVIGHELNNSLAPIRSLAEALAELIKRDPLPQDWASDTREGLEVIRARADSLSRFMAKYSQLARLPAPDKRAVSMSQLMQRIARLESGWTVHVADNPDVVISADPGQLEQLLINLIKNAGEANAARQCDGQVMVAWRRDEDWMALQVTDAGPGLPDSGNVFTPFFTTKQGGSGVGLLLSRQIAEAHGGSLNLQNREDGKPGCTATLRLPVVGG